MVDLSRSLPNFSKVAGPLQALTRKDIPFTWTPACQEAFDQLKQLLTNVPVLAFPEFEQDFRLETNASGAGLGAMLSQESNGLVCLVAFASRTLQPHEKNYGVTELEALAVVWAVKHFRPYLYGHHCDAFTDHVALRSLLSTPQPSGKLARWGMAIQELDIHIHYRPGKANSNVDALSRFPAEEEPCDTHTQVPAVVATTYPSSVQAKDGEPTLAALQQSDSHLREIIEYLEHRTLPADEKRGRESALSRSQYQVVEGVLYHVEKDQTLRIIPPQTLRDKLFHKVHDGKFGDHLRDAKIYSLLSKHYWWQGMWTDILKWCKACLICATLRTGRATKPPLTPIPVSGPFDRVGVDVMKFPKSSARNQYAVVFMGYLTKWPKVFAVADHTALTIAKLLVEHVISRNGVPAELLSY